MKKNLTIIVIVVLAVVAYFKIPALKTLVDSIFKKKVTDLRQQIKPFEGVTAATTTTNVQQQITT